MQQKNYVRRHFIQLRSEGYKKVQLNVYAGNHAKQLYEKLGFKDVSTLMTKNLEKRKHLSLRRTQET